MNMISLAGTRLCVEASDECWRDAIPYFVQNPQRLAKQGGVGGIMPSNQKRLPVHFPIWVSQNSRTHHARLVEEEQKRLTDNFLTALAPSQGQDGNTFSSPCPNGNT